MFDVAERILSCRFDERKHRLHYHGSSLFAGTKTEMLVYKLAIYHQPSPAPMLATQPNGLDTFFVDILIGVYTVQQAGPAT